MKTNYVPSACKGKDAKFKGSVVLRVPTIDERMQYLVDADMNVDTDEEGKPGGSMLDKAKTQLALLKLSYGHYEKVDIERVRDKKKYKSLDDLRYDSECQGLLVDVANKIAAGFSLGNESGRS
jgi:hypothetical protein